MVRFWYVAAALSAGWAFVSLLKSDWGSAFVYAGCGMVFLYLSHLSEDPDFFG